MLAVKLALPPPPAPRKVCSKPKGPILDACGNPISDLVGAACPEPSAEEKRQQHELGQAVHQQLLGELAAFVNEELEQ